MPTGHFPVAVNKASMFQPVRRLLDRFNALHRRERQRLLEEVLKIRGLMPLLMKQRNGYRWTTEEKKAIRTQLRVLAGLAPYVIPVVMPGGFLLLPVLAWWLDRRKGKPGQVKSVGENDQREGE